MKRFLKIAVATLLFVAGSSLRNEAAAQPSASVSYQTFYDELSPYGEWVDYPEHGYVWVPDAGPDFRPYHSRGHWVYTDDYEWMWVSDYDWGWAPFHYGRWFQDPYYGWMWVPGYEWSPAWVAWRNGGDYYGWAPLRPGINISINFNIGGYNPPYDYWNFAPRRYITYNNIWNHCIDYRRNVTIINNTTIINNYNYGNRVFRTGPSRYEVERYTGRISPVRFRESNRPGRNVFRNNEVSVYRPSVDRRDDNNFRPRTFNRYEANDSRTVRGNENRRNVFDRNSDRQNNDGRIADRNDNDNRIERRNDVRTQDNGSIDRTPRQREERPNVFDRRGQQSQPDRNIERREPQRQREFRNQGSNDQQRSTERPNVFDRQSRQQPQVQEPRQRQNEMRQQPQVQQQQRQQENRTFRQQTERPSNNSNRFEQRSNGGESNGRGNGNGGGNGRKNVFDRRG